MWIMGFMASCGIMEKHKEFRIGKSGFESQLCLFLAEIHWIPLNLCLLIYRQGLSGVLWGENKKIQVKAYHIFCTLWVLIHSVLVLALSLSLSMFLLLFFLGRQREREIEPSMVRKKSLTACPYEGLSLKPGHVPWWGIQLWTHSSWVNAQPLNSTS